MNFSELSSVFLTWFEVNKTRFFVEPKVISHHCKGVEMVFPAIPNVLSADLYLKGDHNYMGICVTAQRNHVIWDFLLDYDAKIVSVSDGFICDFCEGERVTYLTLNVFAIDHTFEFFLTWCNEHIASAQGLALYGHADKGDSSWARLVPKHKIPSTLKADYYIPFEFSKSESGQKVDCQNS